MFCRKDLEYYHPVTKMVYRFRNDHYEFRSRHPKVHGRKWIPSGMVHGFVLLGEDKQ